MNVLKKLMGGAYKIASTEIAVKNGLGKAVTLDTLPMGFKFSTAEQWTGRYWIDGKKIYTKTITVNNGKTKDVRTALSTLGLANAQNIIIDESNSFRQYSSTTSYPASSSYQPVNIFLTTGDYSAAYIDAGGKLATIHGNTGLYAEYTITLRYTR